MKPVTTLQASNIYYDPDDYSNRNYITDCYISSGNSQPKELGNNHIGYQLTMMQDEIKRLATEISILKAEKEEENKIREDFPAAQKAWEHYQFTKQMVSK